MVPETYKWEYKQIDTATVQTLSSETAYGYELSSILASRGIRTKEQAHAFLYASADDMYSPFLMKGMNRAVERINEAVDHHQKIMVYGDYDVDGITATSILYLFLLEIGAHVGYYLPDRMTEGYGLNADAIHAIVENGTNLIITVDTGITAIDECEIAKKLGVDIIITDHHQCKEELPEAVSVIDCQQPGETYPFLYLAGCGISYKLVQAIAESRQYNGNIRQYLELAAVGTIADLVPLIDENRMIVKEGFKRMQSPEIMGLEKLLLSANPNYKKHITSAFIGYNVAPRLNASGRMGDAERSVRLFITKDTKEASEITDELHKENMIRKETESQIQSEVISKIESDPHIKNQRVIVVSGEGWHKGVVGIVSSRIKDRYYRPNILLSVKDGIATGSARSIDGFNLFEALCSCDDILIKFGGHAAAAGLTLKESDIPVLRDRLNQYALEHMSDDLLVPTLSPELILKPSEMTIELAKMIEQIEPYGMGMPMPLIEVKGLLTKCDRIGNDRKTVKIEITDEHNKLSVITFGKPEYTDFYSAGEYVSIVGEAGINSYMGTDSVQLKMKDIHAGFSTETEMLCRAFSLRNISEQYKYYCKTQPKQTKQCCNVTYRLLQLVARKQGNSNHGSIRLDELDYFDHSIGLFPFLQSLYVFEELKIIIVQCNGVCCSYQFIPEKKVLLNDSKWYKEFFQI